MQKFDQRFVSSSRPDVVEFRSQIVKVFLPLVCLGIVLLSSGCSSAPDNRNESALNIDESVGPADLAAMATGSWQVRNDEQRGMALLGGLLSYDMITTEKVDGLATTEKRISAGPLWLAGKTESRSLRPGGEDGHGNWLFPFWRYRVENGKKTLYPLMVIPIPMGKTATSELVEIDESDAPWEDPNLVTEEPIAPETDASYGEVAEFDPAPLVSPAAETYRIRHGDTLWSLAVRFYGDGKRYRDILAANRTNISNVEDISIGTTILLPR